MNRRELLIALGGHAAAAAFGGLAAQRVAGTSHAAPGVASGASATALDFPRKADFAMAEGATYLNGASTHPMPIAAVQAYRAHIERRGQVGAAAAAAGGTAARAGGAPGVQAGTPAARTAQPLSPTAAFAQLINAEPAEIGWVQNTSHGENLVIRALGLDRDFSGNVVTDWLHFEGALVHLLELRRRGLDVRIAEPREGRIRFEDLERLVDERTRLIEVSWVAMSNGFEHDLKRIADLAHAHGALVYADIIQGVGNTPLDVKRAGIDFASTASYKWLMGDFGLGFFYCRQELFDRIERPQISYPAADIRMHTSTLDPAHGRGMSYTLRDSTAAISQTGTTALGVAAALGVSIPYLLELGVDNIQAWRQPLIRRLQQELPRFGFTPQTPPESTSPIVTFAARDTTEAASRLRDARVTVSVYPHAIRIAPSVYNDMADIERLLEALS